MSKKSVKSTGNKKNVAQGRNKQKNNGPRNSSGQNQRRGPLNNGGGGINKGMNNSPISLLGPGMMQQQHRMHPNQRQMYPNQFTQGQGLFGMHPQFGPTNHHFDGRVNVPQSRTNGHLVNDQNRNQNINQNVPVATPNNKPINVVRPDRIFEIGGNLKRQMFKVSMEEFLSYFKLL